MGDVSTESGLNMLTGEVRVGRGTDAQSSGAGSSSQGGGDTSTADSSWRDAAAPPQTLISREELDIILADNRRLRAEVHASQIMAAQGLSLPRRRATALDLNDDDATGEELRPGANHQLAFLQRQEMLTWRKSEFQKQRIARGGFKPALDFDMMTRAQRTVYVKELLASADGKLSEKVSI